MKISVFGNPLVEKDSLPLRILPKLKKIFPKIEFVVQDPTETLNPPKDEWWILDAAEGVKKIEILENLEKLESTKAISAHDYDLTFDLYLLQKLGKLPKVKLIVIPFNYSEKKAVREVSKILKASEF